VKKKRKRNKGKKKVKPPVARAANGMIIQPDPVTGQWPTIARGYHPTEISGEGGGSSYIFSGGIGPPWMI